MVGVSGTSRNGSFHQYYQCVTNRRKGGCKKKTVKKMFIEDLVVNETRRILTPDNIDKIARFVVDLYDSTKLKQYNKTAHSCKK